MGTGFFGTERSTKDKGAVSVRADGVRENESEEFMRISTRNAKRIREGITDAKTSLMIVNAHKGLLEFWESIDYQVAIDKTKIWIEEELEARRNYNGYGDTLTENAYNRYLEKYWA